MNEDIPGRGQPDADGPKGSAERAMVLVPVFRGRPEEHGRDAAARIEEAVGLASAVDLDVVDDRTL